MSNEPLPARRNDFLDRKLIFLKKPLRREPETPTQIKTSRSKSQPERVKFEVMPDRSLRPATPKNAPSTLSQPEEPLLGAVPPLWEEPSRPENVFRKQKRRPSSAVVANDELIHHHPPEQPIAPTHPITQPRHSPAAYTRARKPESAAPESRMATYFSAGGSRFLKPRRYNARTERNRLIFISILCIVLLAILWRMVAR